ncbi:phenylalanine--tRNA ligase subunit beta [Galenea microaerophila]
MKVSENWLRTWVNPSWDSETLAEELSLAGLEVDEIAPVAPEFSKVVVGLVLSVEKHPDADKLNICQVDVGEETPLQIVCGAKNVRAGMKAPTALVGAVLPGGFKIKKAKLRGVPSAGMLCAAQELGLSPETEGLMELAADAPVGMDLRAYLDLDDCIIDVDLTPNRADCLSVEGLARDIAAYGNFPLQQPFTEKSVSKQGSLGQDIVITDTTACPKYLACKVLGFDREAKTPLWMQNRLQRGGISPKHLIVDITNYVMLELGQPMHAFDAEKLQGDLQVRFAQDGETIETLEEKSVTLKSDTLVIADDSGAIALAGIMGGKSTAVSETAQTVLFECAHFAPKVISGKARQYGMHTDSSHRFERGVDPQLPERALERALALLTEIAGGEVSEVEAKVDADQLPQPHPILLRRERIEKLLGVALADETVEAIFQRLNFKIEKVAEGWLLTAPSYRFDMAIEADLVEEVGRIYGYNHLPEMPLEAPIRLPALPETEVEMDLVRHALVQRGYHEVITYSFVEETQLKALSHQPYINLQNPISEEMKAMRNTLFAGLLNTVAYNQKRQQNRVRIFESGLVFIGDQVKEMQQIPMLGGAIVGPAEPESWMGESRNVDFYDLKGDVETLLKMAHQTVCFEPTEHPALHPGQSAQLVKEGQVVGHLGQLHPKLAKQMAVNGKVYLFEIQQALVAETELPKAETLSKFPEVQRDLAFVVDEQLPAQALLDALASIEADIVKSIELFDVYQGEGLPEGKKSLAITIKFQHQDRTLQDEEVDAVIQQMIEAAKKKVSASLR